MDDALSDVRKQIALEHRNDPDLSLNAPTQQFCDELERAENIQPEEFGRVFESKNGVSDTKLMFRRAIVIALGGRDNAIVESLPA